MIWPHLRLLVLYEPQRRSSSRCAAFAIILFVHLPTSILSFRPEPFSLPPLRQRSEASRSEEQKELYTAVSVVLVRISAQHSAHHYTDSLSASTTTTTTAIIHCVSINPQSIHLPTHSLPKPTKPTNNGTIMTYRPNEKVSRRKRSYKSDVKFSPPDRYGQLHPIETTEVVQKKIKDIDVQLAQIPDDEKCCYLQAVDRCPGLVSQREKLMFLRSEVFNVELAARRLVDYWERRVELFGPQKAFQPLTLNQALRDDTAALENGTVGIFPHKVDDAGRQVIVYDPSKLDATAHSRESCTRALWYFIHAALEDEDTQKHGVIVIVTPKDVKFSQFDAQQEIMIVRTLKRLVPMRVSAVHICRPAYFFSVIWPYIKIFFGQKLRRRVVIHYGSDFHITQQLKKYGMHRCNLPSDVGGFIMFDQIGWLRKRRLHGL